jgi:hypothetical protein
MLITSYGEIALMFNVIKQHQNVEIHLVVFDNKDLFKFLSLTQKAVYFSSLTFVPRFSGRRKTSPQSFFKEKRHYKNQLRKIEVQFPKLDSIYCFQVFQNHFCFQIIFSYLNKISKAVIYSPIVFSEKTKLMEVVRNLPRKLLNKALYGRQFTSLPTGHKCLDTIEAREYLHEKIQLVGLEECNTIRQSVNLRDYYIFNHSYRFILFDQPLLNYGRVNMSQYHDFMELIKKMFAEEIRNKQFCVKLHPGNHTSRIFYEGIDVIDGLVPSQCVESREADIWLSISSQSIQEVNIATRISLIELLDFKNIDIKELIYSNFKRTYNGNVLIPKTAEELKAIIGAI